jgi:hypothetical protein
MAITYAQIDTTNLTADLKTFIRANPEKKAAMDAIMVEMNAVVVATQLFQTLGLGGIIRSKVEEDTDKLLNQMVELGFEFTLLEAK